jgi:hypothetical protein
MQMQVLKQLRMDPTQVGDVARCICPRGGACSLCPLSPVGPAKPAKPTKLLHADKLQLPRCVMTGAVEGICYFAPKRAVVSGEAQEGSDP